MPTVHPRFGLLEDFENFPVLWRPVEPEHPPRLLSAGERAVAALITACELLARRGPDPQAWTTPFRQDPIAFFLDVTSDPVNLWGPHGVLVYRNHAAERSGLSDGNEVIREDFVGAGRRFERRCLQLEYRDVAYVLEIFTPFGDKKPKAYAPR